MEVIEELHIQIYFFNVLTLKLLWRLLKEPTIFE